MHVRGRFAIMRAALTAMLVFVGACILVVASSLGLGVRLLAGTLVLIGGNSNPSSAGMTQILDGYTDVTNPQSPFYGYTSDVLHWPAQIPFTTNWDGKTTFEQSQQAGLADMQTAIAAGLATGGKVAVVSYSSSANVAVRELAALQQQGSPFLGQLSFVMIAGMNRPNGGIAERFPGLYVPLLGVQLTGSPQIDTQYPVTDVSWEYDLISDFPRYPLNLLATLNSLVAFGVLHGNYTPADIVNGPRVQPDSTVGNITYITLTPHRLPLLIPLEQIGVPKQLLDLVEPALTVLVDFGYDRSVGPGVPSPASLAPTPDRWLALPGQLLAAVGTGISHALNPGWDTTPTTPVAALDAPVARLTSPPEKLAGQPRDASPGRPTRHRLTVPAQPSAPSTVTAARDSASRPGADRHPAGVNTHDGHRAARHHGKAA